jgi:hypothetical protein
VGSVGRQVVFLCTVNDAQRLLTAFREQGGLLLPERSPTQEPEPLPPMTTPMFANIVRPEDLPLLEWRYVANQRHWVLGGPNPYVVQYTAGHKPDGQPHPRRGGGQGRLYMATNIYDDKGQSIEQSPELLRWAAGLMRWVKQHWTYVDGFHYEGREAHLLLSSDEAP